MGLLYVLDGDTGFVRRYFPMQFHDIQAQIVVADLFVQNNNAELEIVVADMAGNVIVLNINGEILWDIQLNGAIPHTPVIGDIDNDGQLDVIVTAITVLHNSSLEICLIYAIDGATGHIKEG